MSERVSIIIPMKDAAPWIGEAIESLCAQSMEDWQAIIVDNGSSDGSIEATERAASDDPRITIVPGSPEGPSEARNAGLDRARGEFVLFLDADDWLQPRALEMLVNAAEGAAEGAAYGAIEWRDAQGASLDWRCADTAETIGIDRLLDGNAFPIHAAIIAREQLGGLRFDASLTVAEDHDLWLRLATKGIVWAPLGELVGGYRLRPGSLTRDPSRWVTAWRAVITSAFRRARTRRWDVKGVDVSPGRQRRTLNRIALELATRAAPHDRSGRAEACAAIYRAGAFPMKISAAEAASAAYWHMPHSLCLPPTAWRSRARELCPALARWWDRACAEGWAPTALSVEGTEALGALATGTRATVERIVAELSETVGRGARVVVVGLGRNAAALCPALAKAGFTLIGYDDRMLCDAAAGRTASIGGVEVVLASAGSLSRTSGAFVTTPQHDDCLIEKLPPGASVVRWCESARRGAHGLVREIREAWPARSPVAGRLESARRGEAAA